MRRAALLCALTAILAFAVTSDAGDPAIMIVPGTNLGIVPRGGAAGGDALYCNYCDLIGLRNIQGGGPGGQPFDIGAGSTQDPGTLSLNWDVGRVVTIWDGHKHPLAQFGPGRQIVFWVKPKFRSYRTFRPSR